MDESENYISLRPQGSVGTDSGLPSRPTAQALIAVLVVIVISLAGILWVNGKVATSQNSKKQADAAKQKLVLETSKIKEELQALEGAGGVERLDSIKTILNSRMDWKKVILAIGNSAPRGVTVAGFSASSPNAGAADTTATPATGTGTGLTVPLSGTAPSTSAVSEFIRNLKKETDVISSVQLDKSSSGGNNVTYAITLQLSPPKQSATSSSTASTPQSDGTAEGAAADAVKDTPQGGLVK